MAPTPSSKSLFSTPSSKSHHSRTPQSKRLNFTTTATTAAGAPAPEHPVEVIGRIRNLPEVKTKAPPIPSAIQITGNSLRLRTEIGYRDFSLDGVSSSEDDDLDEFYKKIVGSRINGVKLGNKCTIMMYGPTGSGKSHTMFGCPKQPGIVYKALKDILGGGEEEDGERKGFGTFVQVTVLEIYNEEIYDLLSSGNVGGGGFSLGWPKGGSASKVRLDVMGGKAKNATFISGNEAGKILKEIQKVEKRRIVKSTLCNERSSRSHCMIILDVPTVGGQLLLVDMAGSENIEQAGQTGLEAKLQTAKINQGNIALKRVVESIANGDSHVPFRDSKLTMLLQDSFEDDKSKILMILCASPDPKELHKTIATLEYGAKAKCIVRGPHTPIKDKGTEDSSSHVILGSRIAALDQFIHKLQLENKMKEKECNEAQKELKNKEEEVSKLRARLSVEEGRKSEEEINSKVHERTQMLKNELEKRIKECEKMANEIVEMERRKMEEKMLQQQQENEMLRARLEEIENELRLSRGGSAVISAGSSFMQKLLEACPEDSDMVKSMDLSKSMDLDTGNPTMSGYTTYTNNFNEGLQNNPSKAFLTTVYEEDECENDEDVKENLSDEEVQKEVIEEKMIVTPIPSNDTAESRQKRIQNIFTLCGNYRELSQHNSTPMPMPAGKRLDGIDEPSKFSFVSENEQLRISNEMENDEKENQNSFDESSGDIEVYVKWEASKENAGQRITTVKVMKDSTLADLRKLIEIHLGGKHDFTFLVLGDPSGAPVPKELEGITLTTKLPICNSKLRGHLACLRPVKPIQQLTHLPFSPLENKMVTTPYSNLMTTPYSNLMRKGGDCLSPVLSPHLSSTPFITVRRQ